MTLERFFRSRWWLAISMIVPVLVAGAGAVYLARKIAGQQAEIVRLSAELQSCRGR